MKKLLLVFSICLSSLTFAQTINDGLMMAPKTVCTGFLYTTEQWKNYWEGDLKRTNDNIGTLTTTSVMWMATYGVTNKLNVIAMLPYIQTDASGGTLHPMKGVQDLSLAVKYNFFKKEIGMDKIKGFGAFTYSRPMSNYTPDFLPLSIGMASQNLSYRVTGNYSTGMGIYINASAAYTWRSNVKLDRPSYYTDGNIFFTNEVKMPNVFDYVVNVGYKKKQLQVDLNYMQQNTLGGGDIRRQDMPFVSNRMNYSKIGAFVMYYVTKPKGLAIRAVAATTIAGRNVGQTTTLTGGLLYTIRFAPKPE
jgi:hypothetical protein